MTGPGAGRTGGALGWLYAASLLGTGAALWAVGLPELAVAFVLIEAAVGGAMLAVRRAPARPRGEPTRRAWIIPVVMVGALLAMVGVAVLASRMG